jgi:glucose-1-phosphate thymidylyltransferase
VELRRAAVENMGVTSGSPITNMDAAIAKTSPNRHLERNVVGLLPAGGHATRIAPLPCSKELYPIGFRPEEASGEARPKVVSHYLLEKMRFAGITKAYFVLRPGKWDIPAYFGDGSMLNMHLAYLILGCPFGVPFTLDQAYPFVRDVRVAFGFPDILLHAEDVFEKLLARHSESGADLTLGLTPVDQSPRFDKVDVDRNGAVREIHLGLSDTRFRYGWAIAVWNPNFTEFLHEYVKDRVSTAAEGPELSAGHAIKTALHAGLRMHALSVDEEPYLDIGTPEGLAKAVRRFAGQELGFAEGRLPKLPHGACAGVPANAVRLRSKGEKS